MVNYKQIITKNADRRFGKPCVRETRISVYDVLNWLSCGMSFEEILSDFPELCEDDILACLSFAADREAKLEVI